MSKRGTASIDYFEGFGVVAVVNGTVLLSIPLRHQEDHREADNSKKEE